MNIYKLTDSKSEVLVISADHFKVEGNYVVFYISTLVVGRLDDITTHEPIYLCSNAVTVEIVNE